MPGWAGFKRVTTIEHYVYVDPNPPGLTTDYKKVSVVVTATGLQRTVLRTITKGAP